MPHNISVHVAPAHNNIHLPMCLSLPDADTQCRTTGIKIGAISRTSPPPTHPLFVLVPGASLFMSQMCTYVCM